ncbi:MAG: PAS domain S-box protein [Desulfobulbus sp.]|jgi:two-component system nitrogen regulation sensor histidine kinase NtrY|uniref:sensor histidine kinase n=1 Tax=Desulfobulbus sp. TaxID=895 RepID=UPI00284E1928|nr:ATP-binding protein [Desulfobulbus sp.]MDR2550225.1 PAS domain S-box protein [Desulfobulbus sp.]
MLTAEQKKKKQRLVRLVIAFCLLLIPVLGYVQRGLLSGDFNLPLSSTILIFALINVNGLLLLLMLYLVLRNLVELIFERNQKILGSRLRSRLVICFVSLSLVPTAILFFVALRFVSTSMDYWFNAQVEDSLQSSLKLTQATLHDSSEQAEYTGRQLASILESGTLDLSDIKALEHFFSKTLAIELPGAPDSILLLDSERNPLVSVAGPRLQAIAPPTPPSEALRLTATFDRTEVVTQKTALGELIEAIVPVKVKLDTSQTWFLVTSVLIPAARLEAMQSISEGITGYQQLVMLKAPIKFSLIIMLLIITLLVLFGAIWFGFYIARGLTGPIKKLAEATRRVADGDMDFIVEKEADDEMGMLVDSFNSMIAEILASNRQLARTHEALRDSNEVSEQRRRYLETILENVAAGVIALDENNRITTINRFAEELLAIEPAAFLGRDFHAALPKQHAVIVESFIRELLASGKPTIERHLRVTIRRGETLSLQVNVTRMVDDRQQPIGIVIVFDNLTKLEKAQRLAAWQEVARRIAHEIKNPLTPIQLSAQRLRKRYLDSIGDNRDIFDQCTATIVNQVDEIKKLVSEFSDFARMPKLHKERKNLGQLIQEMAILYQEAHRHLTIVCRIDPAVPEFLFDGVQIKRVLINLLDNAVSVLGDGGTITVTLEFGVAPEQVRMVVADDGPGIADEVKVRIFEPYFSTRKTGTGLGLAIAHTIVSEHGGTIRVGDNSPAGTVFAVELPLDT